MRGICLILALLGVPTIAAAQYQTPAQRGSASGPIRGSSLPAIGLPLPSIGLPFPSLGLPPPQPLADDGRNSGQRGGNGRGGNGRGENQRGGDWRDGEWRDGGQWRGGNNPFRHQRSGPAYIYVGPQYPYGGPYYPYAGMSSIGIVTQATVPGVITVVPDQPTGRLLLEVEPADILQVFVDGEYVGTPADLGGALDLRPGSRRIEFRAPGYKTLTIDAQIVSDRTIVYRATLDRIAPTRVVPAPSVPAAPPAAIPPPYVPSGNRTMYLIPGCYMGNVAPQDLKLPAGCDLSRLTTIKP